MYFTLNRNGQLIKIYLLKLSDNINWIKTKDNEYYVNRTNLREFLAKEKEQKERG